jgi:hypothetical protein
MRCITVLLTFLLILSASGCFKKEKQLSEWALYKKSAEEAIESLRELQTFPLDKVETPEYRVALSNAEAKINNFLQLQSPAGQDRASRQSVEAALRDFRLVAQLSERKRSTTGQHSNDKIFASSDTELFNDVKVRYPLGPELLMAKQPYYYIDPIIHEAWRSAGNNILRANNKLAEEAAAEAKAAKKAKTSAANKTANGKPGI